jgi:hypothetical protein
MNLARQNGDSSLTKAVAQFPAWTAVSEQWLRCAEILAHLAEQCPSHFTPAYCFVFLTLVQRRDAFGLFLNWSSVVHFVSLPDRETPRV